MDWKILFVTNSLGNSRSLQFCKASVKKFAPKARHQVLQIDQHIDKMKGRFKYWNIHYLENKDLYKDYDYLIHIDEDAFLLSETQLYNLLDLIHTNSQVVLAGPSNGVISKNPFALNSYFLVIHVRRYLELDQNFHNWPEWNSFSKETAESIYCKWKLQTLDTHLRYNASGGEGEPYHNLCWEVFLSGKEILYLPQLTSNPLPIDKRRLKGDGSTVLHVSLDQEPLIKHMWFARFYYNQAKGLLRFFPLPKLHVKRYESAFSFLIEKKGLIAKIVPSMDE